MYDVPAGAEWLEVPGNCLAASISQQNTWVVLTPTRVVEIPVEGHIDESEGIQPSMPSLAPIQEPTSGPGATLMSQSGSATHSTPQPADPTPLYRIPHF